MNDCFGCPNRGPKEMTALINGREFKRINETEVKNMLDCMACKTIFGTAAFEVEIKTWNPTCFEHTCKPPNRTYEKDQKEE